MAGRLPLIARLSWAKPARSIESREVVTSFKCPDLKPNSQPCGRRCRILFLPPDAWTFSCRDCAGLSYRSRSQHRNPVFETYVRPRKVLEQALVDLGRFQADHKQQAAYERARAAIDQVRTFEDWADAAAIRATIGTLGHGR